MQKFIVLLFIISIIFPSFSYAQAKALLIRKKDKTRIAVKAADIDTVLFKNATDLKPSAFVPDTVLMVIYDTISATMPSKEGANKYAGERISLSNEQMFAMAPFSMNLTHSGSTVSRGKYLFVVSNNLSSVAMYNLDSRKVIDVCKLEAYSDNLTCLQITFGIEKYISSDPFPMLYASFPSSEGTNGRSTVKVLRLLPKKTREGEYEALTVEEVQTLYMPQASSANAMGSIFYTIDATTGKSYVYSSFEDDATYISELPNPDANTKEVYYNNSDIISAYKVKVDGKDIDGRNLRGGFINNGKLYYVQGDGENVAKLRVWNLSTKQMANELNLKATGFTKIPQSVYLYHGHLIVNAADAQQYKVFIK